MKAALLLILMFAGDDATRHKEWMDDAQDLKEDLREGLQAKSRAQERPRQNRRYGSHRCDVLSPVRNDRNSADSVDEPLAGMRYALYNSF